MNCAGSTALIGDADDGSSRAAAEGTFAHELAAGYLRGAFAKAQDMWGIVDTVEGHKFMCDQEMIEAIEVYKDAVESLTPAGAQRFIELPIIEQLSKVDPELGGTCDYAAYSESSKHLLVLDFKYGKGVFVSEEDNKQLKVYALGALLAVDKPTETVTIGIVQPRYEGAEPVRTFAFDAFDLLDFRADIQAAITAARAVDAPVTPGPWCKKTFCPAAKTCPALKAMQDNLLAQQFSPFIDYDINELAAALDQVPLVKERIKQIEEFAYSEANRGVAIPGHKLVDKIPRRQWRVDEGTVAQWAKERAIEPYTKTLITPAELEKALRRRPSDAEQTWLKENAPAVSSGTTLVPDADKRAARAHAVSADDFADAVNAGDGFRKTILAHAQKPTVFAGGRQSGKTTAAVVVPAGKTLFDF